MRYIVTTNTAQSFGENIKDAAIRSLISDLTDAIADAACSKVPLSVALWDRAMIVKFLCYKRTVVVRDIDTKPDFPTKIRMGNGRWKATEVIKWVMTMQRTVARGQKRK